MYVCMYLITWDNLQGQPVESLSLLSETGVLFHSGPQLIAWDSHNPMENNLLYSVFINVYDNCILSEAFRIWLTHTFFPWLLWTFPLKIIMLHHFGNYLSRSPVRSWHYKLLRPSEVLTKGKGNVKSTVQ